jgi:hypothetical protein
MIGSIESIEAIVMIEGEGTIGPLLRLVAGSIPSPLTAALFHSRTATVPN